MHTLLRSPINSQRGPRTEHSDNSGMRGTRRHTLAAAARTRGEHEAQQLLGERRSRLEQRSQR
jgi:hypothetical protein